MSNHMTNNEILTMINSINIMEEEIKNLRKSIENMKKEIISKCNHNRVIDHSSSNERTEYYCTICLQNI